MFVRPFVKAWQNAGGWPSGPDFLHDAFTLETA